MGVASGGWQLEKFLGQGEGRGKAGRGQNYISRGHSEGRIRPRGLGGLVGEGVDSGRQEAGENGSGGNGTCQILSPPFQTSIPFSFPQTCVIKRGGLCPKTPIAMCTANQVVSRNAVCSNAHPKRTRCFGTHASAQVVGDRMGDIMCQTRHDMSRVVSYPC